MCFDRASGRSTNRSPWSGGLLAGRKRAVRDRPGDQAPAAERPRRRRADTRPGGRDRRLRARARAARPGDDGAVSASRDWDAATYDRVSGDVQMVWALELLERLPLTGDEVVLDAGCGSGRVTALLADRVPRGRANGVDAAPSLVEHAREALCERAAILC